MKDLRPDGMRMPDLKPGQRWYRYESLEVATEALKGIELLHPRTTYTLQKMEGMRQVMTLVPRKRGFGPIQWTTWQHGYRDDRDVWWEITEHSK